MSIALEVKGIVHRIGEIKETKNNNAIMEIIIRQPPLQDEFGQKRGKENYYKIGLFKNSISDLPKREELVDKKIIARCYLNGQEFPSNNGLAYALNLNCKSYELL